MSDQLDNAALRERAQRECEHAHSARISCGFCLVQANRYIALRDEARAEQREADVKIADDGDPYAI